jgi:hypothetical protein
MSAAFRRGSRMLAKLSEAEAASGVFVPGSRLEPLRRPAARPWRVELVDEAGKSLGRRAARMGYLEYTWLNWFFDSREVAAQLREQDAANGWPSTLWEQSAPGVDVLVEGFDLRAAPCGRGLAAGDYLELELLDDAGSSFRARPVKAESVAPASREAWLAAARRAFGEAAASLGGPAPPRDFLGAALAAEPGLLERPAASLSEFYEEGGYLDLYDFYGTSTMWLSGELVPRIARGEPALARLDGAAPPNGALADLERESRVLAGEIARAHDPRLDDPRRAALRAPLLDLYGDYLIARRAIASRIEGDGLAALSYKSLVDRLWQALHLLALLEGEPPLEDPYLAEAERDWPGLEESARASLAELGCPPN